MATNDTEVVTRWRGEVRRRFADADADFVDEIAHHLADR